MGHMMINHFFYPFSRMFVPVLTLYHNVYPMLAPTSMFALWILCVLVASLMSPTASLVTTYRMQYLQSISVTVSLLFSVGNKTYNYCYYCYYVYDRGCWHMNIDTFPGSVPSRASSSSCMLAEGQTLPYFTGLNWFGFCTDLLSSDRCWGKCNLVIPMAFYTC